jgi:S-adenosylmethionine decarboxylase proenzyme
MTVSSPGYLSAQRRPYVVKVSARFVTLALLSSSLLAFAIGQIACVLIDQSFRKQLLVHRALHEDHTTYELSGIADLPNPTLQDGKQAPKTKYFAKFFDTTMSDIQSRWIVTDAGQDHCLTSGSSAEQESCRADRLLSKEGDEGDGAEHLPKGQHLLMDIERVSSTFLNSEEQLAKAMLDLVDQCGLTLLSYHCHGLAPSGVSCAGILLESHVSFHTWPSEGVITLDLFTCGDESLLPIVTVAENLFSVPEPNSQLKPHMIWAHKVRGFPQETMSGESEITDFFNFPIGRISDFKREVRPHPLLWFPFSWAIHILKSSLSFYQGCYARNSIPKD